MTRAILLDLGKTIVPFDFSIGYQRLQNHCGLPPETIRARIRESGLVQLFETGLIEADDFVEQLGSAIETKLERAEFGEIWGSIFARETLIPDSFLSDLHRRYRLVLVSNTNSLHFETIQRNYPLLRHFDVLVLSYKIGAMKPAAAIWEAAVEAAQCSPGECFFTDDIPEYVVAAREFGIDAELFESFEKLRGDLAVRGVEVG